MNKLPCRLFQLTVSSSRRLPSLLASSNAIPVGVRDSRFAIQTFHSKCTYRKLFSRCNVSQHVTNVQSYASKSNANVTAVEDIDSLLPLRFIYVRTSVDKWHETPEGIMFDVGYVDSMQGQPYSARVPVILGLPGTIGSHKDLAKFLLVYVKLGYRVIIPSTPGSFLCKGRAKSDFAFFSFTLEEKAEFVKDFLAELSIPKVDVLVTNSCSVYTAVQLCVHDLSQFKSLVMINPPGMQPTQSMRPTLFHVNVANVWDLQYFLHPIMDLTVYFGKIFTQKRSWSVSDIVTFSRNVASLIDSYNDIRENAKNIQHHRNLPMLAIYQDDSADLDRAATEEMLGLMGIQSDSITTYDRDGTLVSPGAPDEQRSGLHIAGPAGTITDTQLTVIRKRLWDFFKIVRPDL